MRTMEPPQRIVVGTRNKAKLAEIEAMLADFAIHVVSVAEFPGAPDVEEDGDTFEANATKKATELAQALGEWVLADDSGLEVDALDGRPGVYSARYAGEPCDDAANVAKLLAELEGVPAERRTARFRCAIALASPGRVEWVVSGACEGRIVDAPRGENGFGYDPVFLYESFGRTFAEVEPEQKNAVSHRGRALAELRRWVAQRFA